VGKLSDPEKTDFEVVCLGWELKPREKRKRLRADC
jgi:hypothetical protein